MQAWYGPDTDWDRNSVENKGIGKKWFVTDPEFDKMLEERFKTEIEELSKGNREAMRKDHYGSLAYFLLGDQFARNIYRGKKESFECAPRTETLAKEILADRERYNKYKIYEKVFVITVLMHAENKEDVQKCLEEYEILAKENPDHDALKSGVKISQQHLDLVVKYGRYPARNEAIGRESTPEELEFLKGDTGYKV